jgi:hypothetical protein
MEQQGGASPQDAAAAAVAAATQHYQQNFLGAGRFGPGVAGPGGRYSSSTAGMLLRPSAELPTAMTYSDAAATAAADALLAESMRRGTMDNVTVIVMLLQWS